MEMGHVTEHLYLVCTAGFFTTIIGLILGTFTYLFKPSRSIILSFVDIMQTIPVLALLGILMLFFGATSTTVIIGLVLYSLLPMVRNTYIGLENVNKGIKEAAEGMGMTKVQRLIKVELPLSIPLIVTGIRIAIVTSIGTAVFGAVVGGGGLGATINRSIFIRDLTTLVQATIVLMVMALIFDFGMSYIERKLQAR
jgi:osmoprotectant transport system permease protein